MVISSRRPPEAAHSGAVLGPYKLIEPIGEGGMGTVWMAQQSEPVKRVVALKLIKAGMLEMLRVIREQEQSALRDGQRFRDGFTALPGG